MDQSKHTKPTVAVLGAGRMGAAMARTLLAAGFPVRAWDRTRARAAEIGGGVQVADSPASAAAKADVVITMLADGDAVASVMRSAGTGAAATMRPRAVWAQMSTIGVEWTGRLASLAAYREIDFVDAPVSGSDGPARDGSLVILASGARDVRERVQPVFDALGRRTVWLGPAGDGSRLKLALNTWLASITEAMAETLALTEALGLDPQLLLDTIADGPLAAPYTQAKGTAMLDRRFEPGFALRLALKDARLALAAAGREGVDLPLAAAVVRRWDRAVADGHADDDVASVIAEAMPADHRRFARAQGD
jgi:3-hydroxyisobutyrate dehydrogenase